MTVLVSAEAIYREFRRGTEIVTALGGVSLSLLPGELVCVMGRSGSGKSTLLAILGGLDTPTRGVVRFAGQDLHAMSEAQRVRLRREAIGFVFQAFHLIPHLTAEENVALPLRYRGVRGDERRDRARDVLARLGLSGRLGHRPDELSGGEAQRVSLARALVGRPRLLLADEPTGELDTATAQELGDAMVAAQQQNPECTVLLATHDPALAARATRVVQLRDGQLISN